MLEEKFLFGKLEKNKMKIEIIFENFEYCTVENVKLEFDENQITLTLPKDTDFEVHNDANPFKGSLRKYLKNKLPAVNTLQLLDFPGMAYGNNNWESPRYSVLNVWWDYLEGPNSDYINPNQFFEGDVLTFLKLT